MEAELSIGGNAVAGGHCVAAFAQPEGKTGVFMVVSSPVEAAALLARAAGAVRAGLQASGVPRKQLDVLLAAVARALAGPPEELALPACESGTAVAVELLEGGRVLDRVEGAFALCAVTYQEGVGVLVHAPAEALVVLARTLVAAVSVELGGEGVDARRAALLRELTNAVLNPEACMKRDTVREYP